MWASQWHQCLCHPGSAFTLWPHEASGYLWGPGHQEEPRAHCNSARSDNCSEDFILVTNSSQGTSYDLEVRETLQGNASPDHHWPTTQPVVLDDVTGSRTFTTPSPDSFTPVTCAQCEPAFICEENWVPVAGGPANSGVLWWMPIGLWAQVPLQDVRPSCHPHGVCFWQFGQKHAH